MSSLPSKIIVVGSLYKLNFGRAITLDWWGGIAWKLFLLKACLSSFENVLHQFPLKVHPDKDILLPKVPRSKKEGFLKTLRKGSFWGPWDFESLDSHSDLEIHADILGKASHIIIEWMGVHSFWNYLVYIKFCQCKK